VPTDSALVVGHHLGLDPLPFQLQLPPKALALPRSGCIADR